MPGKPDRIKWLTTRAERARLIANVLRKAVADHPGIKALLLEEAGQYDAIAKAADLERLRLTGKASNRDK